MLELLQSPSSAFLIVYYVLISPLIVNLLLQNRNPLKTQTYILLLFLLPVVGIIIWFFFGQSIRKQKVFAKKGLINRAFGSNYFPRTSIEASLFPESARTNGQYAKLIQFLHNDLSPLTINNKVEILKNGEEKFPAVLRALKNAQHHIHLEYYIYSEDEIGTQLMEILKEKAKAGLEVRMVVDGVGSFQLSKQFSDEIRSAGIQLYEFMPVLFPNFTSRINYRNHRKIIVIDGHTGFTGGINVDDKYINKGGGNLYWRDTHIKIVGEAVHTLQFLFFLNWQFITQKEFIPGETYFPKITKAGDHCVQINASGPDLDLASIMESFLIAINAATQHIRIATPYFIPNESILNAIITAAKSNVIVELMIPDASDSWLVQAASLSYLKLLLQAGVKVYRYQKGFLHAKVITIDETFSSVGTTNMDYRSFDLNHEVNSYLYDKELVQQLISQFEEDKLSCSAVDLDSWKKRPLTEKFKESISRLLAPLL